MYELKNCLEDFPYLVLQFNFELLKMAGRKINKALSKKTSGKNSEGGDLIRFIEKKKIQNEALRKIMIKLNGDENLTANK